MAAASVDIPGTMKISSSVEAMQRKIAAEFGISWEAYFARSVKGIKVDDWPAGFAHLSLWRNGREKPRPAQRREGAPVPDPNAVHNAEVLAYSRAHTTPDSPHYQETPLDEAVKRYGQPGWQYRFFSYSLGDGAPSCIGLLGWRGYEPVLDENGDTVKVGTLVLGKRRLPKSRPEGEYGAMMCRPRLNWRQRISESFHPPADEDVCRVTWHVGKWRGVLALYAVEPRFSSYRYGIDLVMQIRGRHWFQRKLRFYDVAPVTTDGPAGRDA
jgi:hypothetical protein